MNLSLKRAYIEDLCFQISSCLTSIFLQHFTRLVLDTNLFRNPKSGLCVDLGVWTTSVNPIRAEAYLPSVGRLASFIYVIDILLGGCAHRGRSDFILCGM